MELHRDVAIEGNEKGWVSGLKCVKMELGEADASGRRSPVAIPGSEYVLDVEAVYSGNTVEIRWIPVVISTAPVIRAWRRSGRTEI